MLEWTGERFLPWLKESTIAYEHLHRYAYATALVKDKRVLDLACGEGYGSKMLKEAASSVVGVDLDESTVRHATAKYSSENLQFVTGSITEVPLKGDHSFDVIVCFEAIEHIEDQEILGCVSSSGSQQACDALIALTLERGAVDNVTVVVVRYQPDPLDPTRTGTVPPDLWEWRG